MAKESEILVRPEAPIRDRLTCPLCHDLFKEPTTSVECVHTYCRDCIEHKLYTTMNSSNYNGYQCPLCNVDLGGNPFGSKLCYDRQLDEILMAIFPRPEIDGALQQRREKRDAELNAPKITYAKGQRATAAQGAKGARRERVATEEDEVYEPGKGDDDEDFRPKKKKKAPPSKKAAAPKKAAKEEVREEELRAPAVDDDGKVQLCMMSLFTKNAAGKIQTTVNMSATVGYRPMPNLELPYLRVKREMSMKHLRQYIARKLPNFDLTQIDRLEIALLLTAQTSGGDVLSTALGETVGELFDRYKHRMDPPGNPMLQIRYRLAESAIPSRQAPAPAPAAKPAAPAPAPRAAPPPGMQHMMPPGLHMQPQVRASGPMPGLAGMAFTAPPPPQVPMAPLQHPQHPAMGTYLMPGLGMPAMHAQMAPPPPLQQQTPQQVQQMQPYGRVGVPQGQGQAQAPGVLGNLLGGVIMPPSLDDE